MTGNYDNVATYYDFLAKLIFGDAITNASQFLVQHISANSNVLIVGGGSGFILEQITKMYPAGLTITYVELSEKMIRKATRRSVGGNKVHFVNESILHTLINQKFDVVVTPFLLDNFNETNLQLVFKKLDHFLCDKGLWLFADFEVTVHEAWWQKMLLKTMYLFFKIFCNLETAKLYSPQYLFEKYNYTPLNSCNFFKNFIQSTVYKK